MNELERRVFDEYERLFVLKFERKPDDVFFENRYESSMYLQPALMVQALIGVLNKDLAEIGATLETISQMRSKND